MTPLSNEDILAEEREHLVTSCSLSSSLACRFTPGSIEEQARLLGAEWDQVKSLDDFLAFTRLFQSRVLLTDSSRTKIHPWDSALSAMSSRYDANCALSYLWALVTHTKRSRREVKPGAKQPVTVFVRPSTWAHLSNQERVDVLKDARPRLPGRGPNSYSAQLMSFLLPVAADNLAHLFPTMPYIRPSKKREDKLEVILANLIKQVRTEYRALLLEFDACPKNGLGLLLPADSPIATSIQTRRRRLVPGKHGKTKTAGGNGPDRYQTEDSKN